MAERGSFFSQSVGEANRRAFLELDRRIAALGGDGSSTSLEGPMHITVKNTSGVQIGKGFPVYATGSVGASGAVEVSASRADTASTMPALGLLDGTLAHNDVGSATVIGVIREMDTSSYLENDELYVAPSGGLTDVRPTGASELVQKIGRVVRAHAQTGEILVLGAGRSNDVPNNIVAGGLTIDTDTLHVDATNDRVGIGTTSPSQTLQLGETSGGLEPAIDLVSNGGRIIRMKAADSGNFLAVGSATAHSFALQTNNARRLTIDSAGNVGVNTTTPGAKLHVNGGTSDTNLRVTSSDSGAYIGFDDSTTTLDWWRQRVGVQGNSLVLQTNGNTRMTIDSSGNVGINDTTPSYTLDVNGTGRFTNTVTGTNFVASGYIQTNEIRDNTGQQLVIGAGESQGKHSGMTGEYVYLTAEGGIQIRTPDSGHGNYESGWVERSITIGRGKMTFPDTVETKIQLYSGYTIGIESSTMAFRSGRYYKFYENGDSGVKVLIDTSTHGIVACYSDSTTADYISIYADNSWSRIHANQQIYINNWIHPDPGVRTYDLGSAGAPVYSFRSDTDTGLYRYSTNNFALSGGGTVKLHSDGSGVVANGRMYCNTQLATAAQTATAAASIWCDRNVNATGSYSNYHYGRTNAVFRNTNSARAAVNGFWTTYSTDRGVTYGIWNGEANRFRVTTMTNNGYAYVNAAGFTVISAAFTKERIRTARDENGDGLIDVSPADQNRAFQLFQQLRPVIYDDVEKSVEGVWLGCDVHETREECFEVDCEGGNNTTLQEHDCDMDPDCGGTNESPCPIYMEHYNKLHFIADEVDEVYPHAVSNRADGSVVGIDHHVLATEHINVTQHLIDAVAELQSRVNELEGAA